jgi:thioredoxin-dependent peroxiredoxin
MSRRLDRGNAAPHFRETDLLERPIDLRDFRGRWVLLSFYRYASCPLCNLRVHALSERSTGWRAQGLDVLGVFQSPAEKLRQYVGKQQAPFPLIPDPEQRLYTLYGVESSWMGFMKGWARRLPDIGQSVIGQRFLPGSVEGGIHRIPADFVIDPYGRIAEAYYGRDIGDHLPFDRIERQAFSAAADKTRQEGME